MKRAISPDKRDRPRATKTGRFANVDALRLIHELDVYKSELEMQNEELRKSRLDVEAGLRWYAALFDQAPIGYATVGADGCVQEINQAGAELLGGSKRRLIEQLFGQNLEKADKITFSRFFKRVLQSGGRDVCELEARLGSGELGYLRVTAAVLEQKGKVLLAFEDISERKRREAEASQAQTSLRESNRHKDEFISMLSHELRNPLAPIRNSVYVLGRVPPGSEQAQKAQRTIERQVNHLTRLVDDLLDITRIRCGKVRLRRELVEMRALVRRTVEDYLATFEGSGVSVAVSLGKEDISAWVDPARLVQAVSNLLANAAKFTPRGGHVKVTLKHKGEHIILHVTDSGVGIEPDVLRGVFEPFVQAPQTADRSGGGLGLGLAMVKGLIELHGGQVHISSKGAGCGADVCIELPIFQAAPAPNPVPPAPTHDTRSVLLIEDNQDAAESLQSALELDGHNVCLAHNGLDGIARAKAMLPDVVICDIGLPGMNGYAVARALRNEPALKSTYLVVLSGYAQRQDLDEARHAGFDRHLAKPPCLAELHQILADAPRRPPRATPPVEAVIPAP